MTISLGPSSDELVKHLPKKDQRPYLAAFALTHPDQDHCRGFAKLLDEVDVGELWFTPRVFLEYKTDLCEDAKAFKKEAERRVKKTIDAKGDPGAGHRVRIFGYSELLEEDKFTELPRRPPDRSRKRADARSTRRTSQASSVPSCTPPSRTTTRAIGTIRASACR